jgi:hypothetical protein
MLKGGELRPAMAEEAAQLSPPSKRPYLGPGPLIGTTPVVAPAEGEKSRTIRVHGQFFYYREADGLEIGADGVTARVYDQNDFGDAHLATTVTDDQGYYDVSFVWNGCWNCGAEPDLYVQIETANDRVRVEDATWENSYTWKTRVWASYTGSDLNTGPLTPLSYSGSIQPALHILTNVTRTWRWLYSHRGYDCPRLDVQWPDGATGAYYSSIFGEIHIGVSRQWDEDTCTHEYGHHWMRFYSWDNWPGYCNGICDSGSWPDCGHCEWCPEDAGIAWSEGWPNWLAMLIPSSYLADYGQAPLNTREYEGLGYCTDGGVPGYLGDPVLTEGFPAALLQDIQDSVTDEHSQFPGYPDALSVGDGPIFVCTDLDAPVNVLDFLMKFKARYAGEAEQIWQTAKNNGYEIDGVAPSMVTGLTSTSHTTSGTSPDPTIDYSWNRPLDDASGVGGYSILVAAAPAVPPAVQTVGNVTSYTTSTLAPGTWWLSIRAVDRAGRWCATPTYFGPVTIRAAEPANLAFKALAGWSTVVVPRGTNDASYGSVPAPTTLPGNAAATWWNCALQNTGEATTSTTFHVNLWLDGVYNYPWGIGVPLGSHAELYGVNLTATTVRGGRHVYETRLDATDLIAETNENDNRWARQWVWTPLTVAAGATATRAKPPGRTAGWEAITDGSFKDYNCDGLRFSSSGWWTAMTLRSVGSTEDYDLRLHTASTGATNGFSSTVAQSLRSPGYLDAVIVNRNLLGIVDWDAGVTNFNDGTSSYVAATVISGALAFGDSLTVPFAQDEPFKLWEFYVPTTDVGPVSVTVTSSSAGLPVTAVWLDRTFQTGGLGDGDAAVKTAADGRARLDLTIADAGYNCLVIYRDPRDGLAPVNVTIDLERTPPDLAAWTPTGWHSPFVPRPAADGTAYVVPTPDTLHGNAASTYFNVAVRNWSAGPAPAYNAMVDLDGARTWTLGQTALPANSGNLLNWATAQTIRGGRHTLVLRPDADQLIEELSETNNPWGEQYVWSPDALEDGAARSRAVPPDPVGGWDAITSGEPRYYNCEGLRIVPNGAWWRALAIVSGTASDVDLSLHTAQTGAKSGFTSTLAASYWGGAQTDFVLVNFNRVAQQPYDVGVTNYSGTQNYSAQTVSSITLATDANGIYGPWTFPVGHLLDLHELWFEAGSWAFRLDSLDGIINWGLSLHPAESSYLGKSDTVEGGLAYANGDGVGEWFTVDLPSAGWYCIATWKVANGDVRKAGSYRLRIQRDVTAVPDTPPPPTATALVGVHPNPFNPQTRITFDLAAATRTCLAVYDLHGALVRRLVDGEFAAGRHAVTWDGRDDAGQAVASGVYMARLEAGTVRQMRKMVLLK